MHSFDYYHNRAVQRCDGNYCNDVFEGGDKFLDIYPFTTECISGYIDFFDLNNKSLLTVGSSGDQVLNSVLKGCKDISVIDINPYTKAYYYLKVAAILNLSFKEFCDFFRYVNYPVVFDSNLDVFSLESFNKMKDDLRILDYESYLFWDELFSSFKNTRIRYCLFSNDEGQNKEINITNLYMNSDTYDVLKKKVKSVRPNFTIDDISHINLNRMYDNIWLSNIGSYHDIDFLKKVCDNFKESLNDDGQMLVTYLYDTVRDSYYFKRWPEIYNLEEVFNVFKSYNLDLYSFPGVNSFKFASKDVKDSILVYKKNKAN